MKNRNLIAIAVTAALGMGFSSFASAGLQTCNSDNGDTFRTWTFDSAEDCGTGSQNPDNAKIEALGGVFDLGADDWIHDDGIAKNQQGVVVDDSSWLDVALLTGDWGGKDVTATWTIADGFWDQFTQAVFTVHVGGGPTAPDDFAAFYITPGEYTGTWSFLQTPAEGGGGGLSNAHFWYSDSDIIENPREVPEPGILVLFGTALLGLGLSRKRKAKA